MIKKKERVVTVSICLNPSEVKRLKSLAKKAQVSLSEAVRQLLKEQKDV